MSVAEAWPRVAVVIVNYRTPDLAVRCVRALAAERTAVPDLEVIVVDGGSGDGSAERLAETLAAPELSGWVRLLPLPINGGFGWANNQAMLRLLQHASPPDFIHLLNPDTVIEPGAVARLAEHLRRHP
ncbi:MAG: glycosyltransferase family 2 protein, partial [Sphingomonadaceae bacterium]